MPARFFRTGLRDDVVDYLVAGMSVDLVGLKGSGRSTILAETLGALTERGWDAVRVQGITTLADRPLEALALAGLAHRPEPRGPSAVAAAADAVARATRDGRTVVAIDDADDLDQASAGALTAAHARRPFPVLSTTRPRPQRLRSPYALPSEVRPGVRLDVPLLDVVDVTALVARTLGGAVTPELVARITYVSGGLPGVAVAIARTSRHAGILRQSDGLWSGVPDLTQRALSRTLHALVADLGPAAERALLALSVAGPLPVEQAAELTTWDALEELDDCGLLRTVGTDGGSLVGVFPPALAEQHRRAPLTVRGARVLAALPTSARPQDDDDGLAGRTWPQAASGVEAETAHPVDLAEPRSETVLDRVLFDESHRQAVLSRAAWTQEPTPRTTAAYLRALLVSGADRARLRDVLARAAPSPDPAETAELTRWEAQVLALALDDLPAARALLQARAAEVGAWAPLLTATQDLLEVFLAVVPAPHDDRDVPAGVPPVCAAAAAVAGAAVRIAHGRPREALDLLGATPVVDDDLARDAAVLTGIALLVDGASQDALAWALRHLDAARAQLDADAIPGHAYVAASALLLLGRLAELRTLLGSVLAASMVSTRQRHYTSALSSMAGALARDEGHDRTSASYRELAAAASTGPGLVGPLTTPWNDTTPGAGDVDDAWERAAVALASGHLVAGVVLAGAVVFADPDPDRIATVREAAAHLTGGLVGAVLRVLDAQADPDPAASVRVGDVLLREGQVWLACRAVAHAVRVLRADGDPHAATALLDAVGAELVARGLDPGRLLPSLHAAAALTAREHEVARLVGDGLSNPEIAERLTISVKTVENHLNRVLHKLGVADRADVARAVQG